MLFCIKSYSVIELVLKLTEKLAKYNSQNYKIFFLIDEYF